MSLIEGWTSCVPDSQDCFSELKTWHGTFNLTTQLHVSARHVTTVYSLENSAILSVSPTSTPTSFFYPANDVAQILTVALSIGNLTQFDENTPATIIAYIARLSELGSLRGIQLPAEYDILRNVLALPLYLINGFNLVSTDDQLPSDMLVNGYLAKIVFRIVPATWSLYTFVSLALFSLVWCGSVLAYCWHAPFVPNVSQYPEMDLLAKCSTSCESHESGFGGLLKGLSNANSKAIEGRIKEKRLYVGSLKTEDTPPSNQGTIVLAVNQPLDPLQARKRYS